MKYKHIKTDPMVRDLARCLKNASPESKRLFEEAKRKLKGTNNGT